MRRPPHRSTQGRTLFPYTTLFRSRSDLQRGGYGGVLRRMESPGTEGDWRSEEHTSELQSPFLISYAAFCLNKKNLQHHHLFATNLRNNVPTTDIYCVY